jgi:uncharacterized protein with HEPN domain
MLPEADRERLLHMRDAAREAYIFVANLTVDAFYQSPVIQHGVQHCIFIIGEAASRISEETRQSIDDIDWRAIRGMRNRLAHAYYNGPVNSIHLLRYIASRCTR